MVFVVVVVVVVVFVVAIVAVSAVVAVFAAAAVRCADTVRYRIVAMPLLRTYSSMVQYRRSNTF